MFMVAVMVVVVMKRLRKLRAFFYFSVIFLPFCRLTFLFHFSMPLPLYHLPLLFSSQFSSFPFLLSRIILISSLFFPFFLLSFPFLPLLSKSPSISPSSSRHLPFLPLFAFPPHPSLSKSPISPSSFCYISFLPLCAFPPLPSLSKSPIFPSSACHPPILPLCISSPIAIQVFYLIPLPSVTYQTFLPSVIYQSFLPSSFIPFLFFPSSSHHSQLISFPLLPYSFFHSLFFNC